jgi:hypothetical protein
VSLIQASSMAITFQNKIVLCPGSMFCFGTISPVADEEGILHRIADLSEKKPSTMVSGKAGAKQEKAQPPALRAKTPSREPGVEGPSTQRTPLSTSPTETLLGRRQRRHPSLEAFRCSRWSDKDKTGRDTLRFIQHQTKACGDVSPQHGLVLL